MPLAGQKELPVVGLAKSVKAAKSQSGELANRGRETDRGKRRLLTFSCNFCSAHFILINSKSISVKRIEREREREKRGRSQVSNQTIAKLSNWQLNSAHQNLLICTLQ